jgi:hypothetical protein
MLCNSFFRTYLEKKVKLLMGCVDDLSQDCNKYFNFQRQHAKQNQAKQQYLLKRVSAVISQVIVSMHLLGYVFVI